MKILLFCCSLIALTSNGCNSMRVIQPAIRGVTYCDKSDTFKNSYQIIFNKEGNNCIFKNISNKTIYINITLSAFSSDELISLDNGMDLTYRLPTVLTPIRKDSVVSFDCHEFDGKVNKAQILELFWIYDFQEYSRRFSALKKLDNGSYELKSKDFKKVEGMMFLEIDRINFCAEPKYKISYEKY